MANDTAAPREQFSGQFGFLMSAIGSAVGLGNIWRFPGVAYTNGGGAFIIPYLVALLTAGIPILMLDYGLGHRFRGSAPAVFRRLGKPFSTPASLSSLPRCRLTSVLSLKARGPLCGRHVSASFRHCREHN